MSAARVARRPSGRDRVVAYPPKVLVCPVGNVQSASDLNAPGAGRVVTVWTLNLFITNANSRCRTCLDIYVEAGVGIEPAYRALQADKKDITNHKVK